MYKVFSAKDGETRNVQLLHPFSVTSRASYSASILPPLSLAYLASTLREAGYPVGIIEALGEGPTLLFLLLSQTGIFCRIMPVSLFNTHLIKMICRRIKPTPV